MAKLGDYVSIKASSKQLNGDAFWLLNLDMVEQQTGRVIEYNYVPVDKLNGSIIQFDTDCVLYSKLRPNLNKVVLPEKDGYATSEMLALRPDTSIISREYLVEYLRSDHFVTWAISKTAGAKMPRLPSKELLSKELKIPPLDEQIHIVFLFKKISELINAKKSQLSKLDELVKSRFIEMFGDPITNPKHLKTQPIKSVFVLKAGDFTAASDISDEPNEINIYPCYGGNGIRGYVAQYNQEGSYSLVGRQGALSGNVQYASGKFKNTEHALLVTPIVEMNSIWLNQLLVNLDPKRYQTGAAQPGLSVKNLQEIQILMVPIVEQNEFATFVEQIDKLKLEVKESLEKLETLKKSLMQKYFG